MEFNDAVHSAYITHRYQLGKSPSNIAEGVTAVKWQTKNINRPDVGGAITLRALAGLRDSAMNRLMSDCLLRISESVAVDVEDVGSVLTIYSSKTDQEGEGAALYIGQPTRRVIRRY